MRFNDYYGRIDRRVICIGIGVISTILWIFHACYLTISPINLGYYSYPINNSIDFSTLVCFLASSAASVLLVCGIKKGIVNYTFPWLAIHFVFLMFTIPLSLYITVVGIWNPYIIVGQIPMILRTVAVAFSWAVVYPYCKSLLFNTTQVQPASPEKDKSLEVSNEPINPYHPV